MNDKKMGCGSALGIGVLYLIVAPILNGLVLSKLWAWFIVPLFGLRGLGIIDALAVALTARMFMPQSRDKLSDDDKTEAQQIASPIVWVVGYPLIALLFGWIYLQLR